MPLTLTQLQAFQQQWKTFLAENPLKETSPPCPTDEKGLGLDLPLKLSLTLDQYDTLTELMAKVRGLTQVILAHTADTLPDIPSEALYHFLGTLDDFIYQAQTLCEAAKS